MRQMQERKISAAAAQDKTKAASSRFAPAISHADVTDSAHLSTDAQPRSTSKTLGTHSSQLFQMIYTMRRFPNITTQMHAPIFRTMFSLLVITRLQDEVALWRQRIASYPTKIQGMRAAMGRHERFRSELAAGFKAEKNTANLDWRRALECLDQRRDISLAEHESRHRELHRAIKELEKSVLSCRSREAATTARVSLLRELASAGNLADLGVAPRLFSGAE